MTCLSSIRATCCGASTTYEEYRRSTVIVVLCWLSYLWLNQMIDTAVYTIPVAIGLFATRHVLWVATGVCLFLIVKTPDRYNTPRHKHNLLLAAWALFLTPAFMLSFVTWRNITPDNLGENLLEVWNVMATIYVYLGAIGVGIVAGAQTIPAALRSLKLTDANAIFMLTTAVGFGTRYVSYLIIVQAWALIDNYSVVYAMLWHAIYLIRTYSGYTNKNIVTCLCYIARIIIICVALARFAQTEDEYVREVVGYALGIYIGRTLNSIVLISILSYITAALTRLIILTKFLPPPTQTSPDELELLPT